MQNKDIFNQLLGGELFSSKLTNFLKNNILQTTNSSAKMKGSLQTRVTPEIQKTSDLAILKRLLKNQPPTHSKLESEKNKWWTRRYKTNQTVINCCEDVLSKTNRKVFYVDTPTKTVLGNLTRSDAHSTQKSPMTRVLTTFAFLANFVLSLALSSFKLKINWAGKGRSNLEGRNGKFDSQNSLGRKTSFYSKTNYSSCGLTGSDSPAPSVVKLSVFLVLKLFLALQIVLKIGNLEDENLGGVGRSACIFFVVFLVEIVINRAKLALDVVLRLDVNYFQTRAYIREKDDLFSSFFDNSQPRSQNKKLQKQLIDNLNFMRIRGNIKKEFIVRYFTKRIKNLFHDASAPHMLRSAAPKVFTGYRNEDMMRRDAHSRQFVYFPHEVGRRLGRLKTDAIGPGRINGRNFGSGAVEENCFHSFGA